MRTSKGKVKALEETSDVVFVLFPITLKKCVCGVPMMHEDKRARYYSEHSVLGHTQQKALMKEAGIVEFGAKLEGKEFCVDCVSKGVATFICFLCQETRESQEIKERFGDPPEYLCTVCYETKSAMIWDDAQDRLNESHKYDYD